MKEHSVFYKLDLPLFMVQLIFWDKSPINNIMTCCVILQNMIIQDERDLNLEFFYDNVGSRVNTQRNPNRITYGQIEDLARHTQLNGDLIEHHWQLHGAE
jgi:hypothetical protein